jgi:hypothetical protein
LDIETTNILGLTIKIRKTMKKTIAIASLILGIGTSVFAATPVKPEGPKADESVSFSTLDNNNGFAVKVGAEKSTMIIYDQDGNVTFKDQVSKGLPVEKGYNLKALDYGDYTVEVITEKSDVKKTVHVYDDEGIKSFIFLQ